MKKVGVIGCGLMGSGIAQVSVQAGYHTTIVEIDQSVLDDGLKKIGVGLERARRRDIITDEQAEAAKANLASSAELESLKDCDLVIEAATENPAIKKEIFATVGKLTGPDAILASNTSSISITELGAVTERPERVVGMHFFNPVPAMKLVEIVRGVTTTDEVMSACHEFAVAVGKDPIECKDTPAFVVNKLLIPYLLDAIRMVEDGVATVEDVDKAMVLGCGYPMGPLKLIDYVGLDTILHAADVMYGEFKDAKHAAPVMMRRMVQAGQLGRKSGRGFYNYEKES